MFSHHVKHKSLHIQGCCVCVRLLEQIGALNKETHSSLIRFSSRFIRCSATAIRCPIVRNMNCVWLYTALLKLMTTYDITILWDWHRAMCCGIALVAMSNTHLSAQQCMKFNTVNAMLLSQKPNEIVQKTIERYGTYTSDLCSCYTQCRQSII